MAAQVLGSQYPEGVATHSHSPSAVSWPAIIAGAFVAAAVSLIFFALGSGLGFAAMSPWQGKGVSGVSVAVSAAIWLILTQWISAGVGGYIAGRLRTRWIGTHTHEVFFRDTAHGLITWAVASVLVAFTLASALSSTVAGAGHAAGHLTGPVMRAAGRHSMHEAPPMRDAGANSGEMTPKAASVADYNLERLLRPADAGAATQTASDPKPEVAHIIANAVATGSLAEADRAYLAQIVAQRSGVSLQDAQKRVDDFTASAMDVEAKAKAAADAARKRAAEASIYLALSLLVGAFIASVSAALGGRLRDEHP
jgi:hypothetical protein